MVLLYPRQNAFLCHVHPGVPVENEVQGILAQGVIFNRFLFWSFHTRKQQL